MNYIDLTYPLTPQTPVYPGDPIPQIIKNSEVTKDGFTSHTISVATHVGTHIDAPAHMIAGGKNISDYPIEHFIGRGVLIDARNQQRIDDKLLLNLEIHPGDIVLLYTGRNKIFATPEYFTDYPEVTEEFAQKLVDAKVKILGMDQASPDYSPFKTHTLLLQNDIVIIENLTNVDQLVNKNFTITALPLNTQTEAAPVRVIAHIQ